jgi:hypothetical protein
MGLGMISQGQNQLLPASTRANRKPRILRFDISSFDRNVVTEQTNAFRWRFPNALKDITEMSIVGGVIPVPVTNMFAQSNQKYNYSYNKFTALIGSTPYTITIPPGNYTAATFATALAAQLDAATASAITFTVGISPLTGVLNVSASAGTFAFLFGTGSYVDRIDTMTGAILKANSPAIMMGFGAATDYASVGTVMSSPNAVDMSVINSRIYLYLNYDTTQDMISFGRGLGRREPSAIIYMDTTQNDRKYINKETYSPLIVQKPAPLARVNALEIRFEDMFGNPIDFGNKEVNLALELTVLEN